MAGSGPGPVDWEPGALGQGGRGSSELSQAPGSAVASQKGHRGLRPHVSGVELPRGHGS